MHCDKIQVNIGNMNIMEKESNFAKIKKPKILNVIKFSQNDHKESALTEKCAKRM